MSKAAKEEYYIKPAEFRESLRKYYDSDILTDDLLRILKRLLMG